VQKLCQHNVHWDEPLDAAVREEWTTIMNDIQKLSKLSIDRCYFKQGFSKGDVTLHVLADVSTKAVAFLTCSSEVTFVFAKNRIAPLKNLTLPKLELMAAVIASTVAKFVSDSLQLHKAAIPDAMWNFCATANNLADLLTWGSVQNFSAHQKRCGGRVHLG